MRQSSLGRPGRNQAITNKRRDIGMSGKSLSMVMQPRVIVERSVRRNPLPMMAHRLQMLPNGDGAEMKILPHPKIEKPIITNASSEKYVKATMKDRSAFA